MFQQQRYNPIHACIIIDKRKKARKKEIIIIIIIARKLIKNITLIKNKAVLCMQISFFFFQPVHNNVVNYFCTTSLQFFFSQKTF